MKSLLQYCATGISVWLVAIQVQAGKIDPDFPAVSYVQYESFDIIAGKFANTKSQIAREIVGVGSCLLPCLVSLLTVGVNVRHYPPFMVSEHGVGRWQRGKARAKMPQ